MHGMLGTRGHYGKKMQEHRKQEKILDTLFETYDTDHSNTLSDQQLSNLLRNLAKARYDVDDMMPTPDDLAFIVKLCDKDGDKAISRHELKAAIAAWDMYVQDKGHTDEVFDKYDTNKTGRLGRFQLHAFLLDLLAKEEIYGLADEDVTYVMKHADVTGTGSVTKMELAGATAAFMVRRHEHEQRGSCSLM